ncbi:MAG: hypothetical protein KBT10_08315, partial [Bacteroidales bacterium]|nr:hypothetical protein [Candidatus Sodaliphilus aphodohippi]
IFKSAAMAFVMACAAFSASATTPGGEAGEISDDMMDKLLEYLHQKYPNEDDFNKALNGYLTKTLPMYNYFTKDRVMPDFADLTKFSVDTVAAAPCDEIFYGVGDPRNYYKSEGLSEQEIAEGLEAGGKRKYNQSYVWGITSIGDRVYWASNTNYICTMMSDAPNTVPGGDAVNGFENGCWACEFNSGIYGKTVHAQVDPTFTKYSDVRIPHMYVYDTKTGIVEDITPEGDEYAMNLQNCQGFRSAGNHHGVVFFGGPAAYGGSMGTVTGAGSFFAYDDEAHKMISCSSMDNVDGHRITNVRRWYVYDDVLYCGVRVTDSNGVDRGAILRWYGDKNDPWQFHVVGWTACEAAEICEYHNRLYIGGWLTASQQDCAVMKSPIIPEGGLQPVGVDEPEWDQIWRMNEYDKLVIAQRMQYVGCLQVWKDKLYWGTFTLSYVIRNAAMKQGGYTDMTTPEALAWMLGAFRQTTFWRTDADDNVELLYGEEELPLWNKNITGEDTWRLVPTGWTPKFGRAGYGNPFTVYTWTMTEYHGDLYLGTNDVTMLVGDLADNTGDEAFTLLQKLTGVEQKNYGFDLLRMQDPEQPLQTITRDGFGNHTAYGIRNFTICNNDMYVGSAAPYNIAPYSGWHMFKVHEEGFSGVEDNMVQPGIVCRKGAGNITVSSFDGKNLSNVSVYGIDGKLISTVNTNSNVGVVSTDGCAAGSTVIVKTTTAEGKQYTGKIIL